MVLDAGAPAMTAQSARPDAAMTPVGWHAKTRACPLCGSHSHRVLGNRGGASHRAGAGVATVVVRCRQCHGVYTRPTLLPDTNPYDAQSADYFRLHDTQRKVAAGQVLAARAAQLRGRVGRMLELGCGRGELLIGARQAGWTVRGVEMTAAFAEGARSQEVEVEAATVESCLSLDESWDAVLLAAVLEHLYDPRACLARIFDALSPGGVAFIDVPNECSLWTRVGNAYMRLRGRRWVVNLSPTFPPFHVVGFCPTSLRRLIAAIGFELVELTTHRWNNELAPGATAIRRLEHLAAGVVLSVGAWIGAGAGITVWVRKPTAA